MTSKKIAVEHSYANDDDEEYFQVCIQDFNRFYLVKESRLWKFPYNLPTSFL